MRDRWRFLAGLGVMWGAVAGTLLADDVHWEKPYDYEVRLDNRPQAQGQGFAHYHYVTAGEFGGLKQRYNASIFDEWMKRLGGIRKGMTMEEVKSRLKPKEVLQYIIYGNGVPTILELDDYYCVHGGFLAMEQTLDSALSQPVAVTYRVRFGTKAGAGSEAATR